MINGVRERGRDIHMKFMHLGDLHLGRTLMEFQLIKDQEYILNQILAIAKDQSVDGVLIAGDVYDKSVPSEEAVRLFDSFLCRLAEMKIKTLVISGNHDSDERLNFGSSLFEAKELYISAKYTGSLYHKRFQDEYGAVNVYLLPFVKASQVRYFYPEEEIQSYDQAVRVVLSHTEINQKERNILVAHQFVTEDGTEPVLGGSEGAAVQNVGLVEKIGVDCFHAFDYVALGHIHSPQMVGRETVRYAGSPLKYSFSEVNSRKSVPIVTFGKKGEVSIELVDLKPNRDLRHLKGKLAQLLNHQNIESPEDFIYATLTDENPVSDGMGIFRLTYPNTVKLDYDNSHTRELEQLDFEQVTGNQSFSELISEFYKKMYGSDISKEEMATMKKVAGEAGVMDETD